MKESWILAFLVLYPFAGGLLCWLSGRKKETVRDYLADFVTVSEFLVMAALAVRWGSAAVQSAAGAAVQDAAGAAARSAAGLSESFAECFIPRICGFGLYFTLDGFRLIYGTVAALMWMMATILSREYFAHHRNRNRFYLFLLLTFGATMGVFLSADLYTTFIFFEIMSFTSYVWVAQEEDDASLRAAETYLGVAVIGGLVMLMGIFLVYHELGTLQIADLLEAAKNCENKGLLYAAGGCLLFGFGAKAGAFPLHIWLPKAHPVAPAPASALLSGILTKTGIYGILVISCSLFLHDGAWGKLILAIGVLTMFGGAVLAVFSINLKRTLACSSMSQIGFILVGVGMQCLLGEENALAVHGTLLHMINHSLIKLVLFLAAGVIFMNTHALDLNKIRGYGRKKPLLHLIFLIGALTIAGVPGLGGYVSKTLLHESILEYGGGWIIKAVEYVFLFSGGLTAAYMTKLYVAVFVEKNEDLSLQEAYDRNTRYMNGASTFALAGSAVLLLVWGLFPYRIMDPVARLGQGLMHLAQPGETVAYFSLKNLSGAAVSLIIGGLVYCLVIRGLLMRRNAPKTQAGKTPLGGGRYIDAWPAWLDLEEQIYRPLLLKVLPALCALPFHAAAMLRPIWFRYIPWLAGVFCRGLDSLLDSIIVGLRKTVYRDSRLPQELREGNVVTLMIGTLLNGFQRLGNHTWNRKHPGQKDYVHLCALKYDGLRESNTIIGRSLSFGLLLAVAGLLLTLIYLIIST